MIEYISGDFFKSPAQVLVNTVNTVGVMGKGIALEFKNKYPNMFLSYRNACENKTLTIGKLMLWYGPDYWVLLFPTKDHWKNPAKLEYIEAGLRKFKINWASKGIQSIAFPKLGCGNGGLSWDDVRPLMESYLKNLPIKVYIYIDSFQTIPEHNVTEETFSWIRQNPTDMSFIAIKEDIQRLISKQDLSVSVNSSNYYFKWENETIVIKNGLSEEVPEESFFELWDYIRANGTINLAKQTKEFGTWCIPILKLLENLKYISNIKISPTGVSQSVFEDGYQLNSQYFQM